MPASKTSPLKDAHIDTLSLRLFVSLCEHRSLSKVSQKFDLVPSAISKRMAALESELGAPPLFLRLRHGMEPTSAGLGLLRHATDALNSVERAAQELRGYLSGSAGHVRMLGSVTSMSGALQSDVHQFLSQPRFREVHVELHASDGSDIVQALQEERFHLGVLWNVQDTSDLVTLPYRCDQLCLVVPALHPLAARSGISLSETLELDLVGLHANDRAEAILRRMNVLGREVSPRYRLKVPTLPQALQAVKAGVGLCFAPLAAQAQQWFPDLAYVPLTDSWARRHFVICYKNKHRLPRAAKELAEFLSSCAEQRETRQVPASS